MTSFLEIALEHAARGWYVHPLKAGDKVPLTKQWTENASTDETTVRDWWARWPDANIGIATGLSKLLVLDADTGISSMEEFLSWRDRNGIPVTYTVRTGRRPAFGVQMYFIGSTRDGKFSLDGVSGDIRSQGGQVVAAGSIHPDSKERYAIIVDAPLAYAPAIIEEVRTRRAPGEKQTWDGPVHDGEGREAFLVSEAGKMRDKDYSEVAIVAELSEINAARCIPSKSQEDIERIAHSMMRYPPSVQAPEVRIGSKPQEKPVTDWRELFHTKDEAEHAPEIKFSIEGFLQDDGITGLSAPPGHRKTLMMLNITRSLLTGEPLFNKFKVNSQAERVVYLVPEVSLTPFVHRLRDFELIEHVGTRFFFRTLSASGKLSLSTPELREAIKGAYVFLDTVPRFIEGNENDAEDIRRLGEQLFELLGAGARSVIGAFHMPKGAKKLDYFDLEICVRGSSDLGALLTACWATRLQNEKEPYKCASYVECVKQRDFEACEPFELMSSERGIMTAHDGSPTVKLSAGLGGNRFVTNRDGLEKHAIAYIKQHPEMSLRELEDGLKGIGIERKKDWIGKKRNGLSADGGVCVGSQ